METSKEDGTMARSAVPQSNLAKIIPVIVRQAQALVIASPEDYEMARVFLHSIATHKNQLNALFAGLANADALMRGKIKAWRVQQWSTKREEDPQIAAEAKTEQEVALAHARPS